MANRSDLRFVKTDKLIVDTYLSLKMHARAPIKVSELCAQALINKSTFYAHYETIEELDRLVSMREVERILDDCPDIELALTQTRVFVEALVSVVQRNARMLDIIIGKDHTRQIKVFEACLLKRMLSGDELPETEMKIVFAIGGAASLLLNNQNQERVHMTVQLIEAVFGSPRT